MADTKLPHLKTRLSIAVIGAGWAGCTAAMELADAGHHVTLLEAARMTGGRARTVHIGERVLDNGQHILLGAYTETFKQIRKVGINPDHALLRLPLQMRYPAANDGMDFIAPRLPAPLHLLFALLRATGLTVEDKISLARFFTSVRWMTWALHEDCSVLTLLDRLDQSDRLIRLLWRPLCIAALNTQPEQASAQIFLNVLHDSLGARPAASDMLIPRHDLSGLLPIPATRYISERGGKVLMGKAVRTIQQQEHGWQLQINQDESPSFDGLVVATSSAAANTLLANVLTRALPELPHEPITTCYLQYPADTRLPCAMHALLDDPQQAQWGQFVFDRGYLNEKQNGLMAVVVSTASAASILDQTDLAHDIAIQLVNAFSMPILTTPSWTQVITEKRATFSCTPALQRATEETMHPSLVLAGDYLASRYPATIESAVRSGHKAASLLINHFAQ